MGINSKAYPLPPPAADPQPKKASSEAIGYEQGFTPRPRYPQSNASAAWARHSASLTNAVHCNIRPRISLAGVMDAAAARAAGVGPYIPGRRPAPRVEIGCGDAPSELKPPSGAWARDLQSSPGGGRQLNPDGGPFSGPGNFRYGLDPLPEVQPPAAKSAPQRVLVEERELEEPTEGGGVLVPPPPFSPRVPGTLHPVNAHFTGDIAGGAADSEIRVYGPVGTPCIIRELIISPDAGVAPGQFLDILVSGDGDATDTATPSGESIFPLLNSVGNLPTPDGQRGIAIPPQLLDLDLSFRVDLPDRWIKLRTFFVAPAIALPDIHVTLVVERMDAPHMAPPGFEARAPLVDTRSVVRRRRAAGSAPSAASSMALPDVDGDPSALFPAWRVASHGLAPNTTGGIFGTYTALDSYLAWTVAPNSAAAEGFRARIASVLGRAGVSDGTATTLIPLSAAESPAA